MQQCLMIPLPVFQSTPPVKAATVVGLINGRLSSISIHAAREGGDLVERYHAHADSDFNPRRP